MYNTVTTNCNKNYLKGQLIPVPPASIHVACGITQCRASGTVHTHVLTYFSTPSGEAVVVVAAMTSAAVRISSRAFYKEQ